MASKGSKFYDNDDLITRLHYLSLPIHFQVEPLPKWQLLLGIEPAYLVSKNNKSGLVDSFFEEKIDLGVSAGTSFYIGHRLGINFRYSFALTSLFEITFTDPNGNPTDDVKYRNQMFALSIEYFLKRKD